MKRSFQISLSRMLLPAMVMAGLTGCGSKPVSENWVQDLHTAQGAGMGRMAAEAFPEGGTLLLLTPPLDSDIAKQQQKRFLQGFSKTIGKVDVDLQTVEAVFGEERERYEMGAPADEFVSWVQGSPANGILSLVGLPHRFDVTGMDALPPLIAVVTDDQPWRWGLESGNLVRVAVLRNDRDVPRNAGPESLFDALYTIHR